MGNAAYPDNEYPKNQTVVIVNSLQLVQLWTCNPGGRYSFADLIAVVEVP